MTKIAMTKTRRTGLMLALLTALISGFAIFLNGYGVMAVGNATAYTTAKNVVAALLLCAVVAAGRTRGVTVSRPHGRGQWWGMVAVGLLLVGQAGLSGGFTASIASGELLILAATVLWTIEVVVAKRLRSGVAAGTAGAARSGVAGWFL